MARKADRRSKIEPFRDAVISGLKADTPTAQIYREIFPDPAGAPFTLDALHKYVRKLKEEIAPEAAEVLREHVKKELPKDLDMLEDIQRYTFDLSKKFHTTQSERTAAAAVEIKGEIEEWIAKFRSENNPEKLVKFIIKKVTGYMQSDIQRLDAMQKLMATTMKAMEVKFRTGLGEIEGAGNIYFVSHKDVKTEDSPDGTREFIVHRGGKDGG